MLSEVFDNVARTRAAYLETAQILEVSRQRPAAWGMDKDFDKDAANYRLALAEAISELTSMLVSLEREHTP